MDLDLPDAVQMDLDLPDIEQMRLAGGGDQEAFEGVNDEYIVEAVESIEWDELRLVFDVKWKNYPSTDNTKEKLSSLLSLYAPYKYLTEVDVNEESECFKIFSGLHKSGFRFHTSDDRFLFCVKKERLLNADYCKPYLQVFPSEEDREARLQEYNCRLRRVPGTFMFKVDNAVDLSMPSPFFGVNILNLEKEETTCQPQSFNRRGEMTIFRFNGTWCLRTDSMLPEGITLFEMGGKPCDPKYASYHMMEMGELLAFSHFVYIGRDVYFGRELSLDRRGVFDAASAILHSCDPNCKMVWNMQTDEVTVVTRRKIKAGEDITLDYFSDNKDMKEKRHVIARITQKRDCVECTCGSDNCRSVLWTESLAEQDYYEYPKEFKLQLMAKDSPYKGVRFNTD